VAGKISIDQVLQALSSLARTGWMLRGVPSQLAESVAEHSYWAAVLAFEIAVRARERGIVVDPLKAAAIAVFHDVGEAVIGDIPRIAGISREEKLRAERAAVSSLPLSSEAKRLQEEFDEEATPEAKIARLAETLATLLKARVYERMGFDVSDISENMEKAARRLARELGIDDIVADVGGLPDAQA